MGRIGPAKRGRPGPKGRRLPAGLSGSHGPGRQCHSETLDGESRTDRRATADDVVQRGLDRGGGRRRAHPGPDLPRRQDGRRRAGEEPAEAARPLPVREAAGDPSGDPAERGQEYTRDRRRGVPDAGRPGDAAGERFGPHRIQAKAGPQGLHPEDQWQAASSGHPVGIPTVTDRVMQAVVKLALEPEWETRFEANSYGFRPGRCAMDAIEAVFIALTQMGSSRWILDADISGCFDAIAHGPLLARLPTFTRTIERWLKAGSIDMGAWRASEAGTPQGGILSPVLANVALDGMERLFGGEDRDGNPVKAATKKGMDKSVVLIRYADDVLVTAPSKENSSHTIISYDWS